MNIRSLFRNLFAKASDTWIASTVTSGEAVGGRYNTSPAKAFVARATQYVLICATKNAQTCACQRLRLYAPASAKAKGWRGKRLNASTLEGRKRLQYLKSRTNGPGAKASEYAEYAEDVQEITEHEVLDLIHKPNPWQTGHEFDELAYMFKELAGNAFVNLYTDEATPEMYHLAPQFTAIVPSETQFISGYRYDRDAANPVVFTPEEVMHFKHNGNPLSPYYGLGSLQPVLLEADLAAAATQAEMYRWVNGGRPDFVVKVDEASATNKEKRDQIRAEIGRTTKGVKKSGNFLILGNSEVIPLGFKPKDMEYIAGLTRSDELIWNAFGVPQSELKMNDANYASSSTGNVQYLSRTIAPRCGRHAQDLTEMLLYQRYGAEPGSMWFAYDEIVPEDELTEAEMDRLDVAAGILTLNEARANRGLEPHPPEVGDVVRINGTSVERLDAPPVAPMIAGPGMDDEEDDDNEEDDTADAVAEKVLAGLLPHMKGAENVGTRSDQERDRPTPESDIGTGDGLKFYGIPLHKDGSITDAPGGTFARLDGFTGRLEAWYRSAIDEALKVSTSGVIRVSGVELEKIIEQELGKLFAFAAQEAAKEVGGTLNVAPSAAIEFLGSYRVRLAQAITEDVSSTLTATVRDGLQGGESYDAIARRITDDLPDFAGWRAERIARTETANALTEGRVMAWEELGVASKQWLLSGNACEVCMSIAQTYAGPIPMSQAFFKVGDTVPGTAYTVSWRDIQGPPAHPACACGLLPVLGD